MKAKLVIVIEAVLVACCQVVREWQQKRLKMTQIHSPEFEGMPSARIGNHLVKISEVSQLGCVFSSM